MIVTGSDLEELVESENYEDWCVPLTIENVENYKGANRVRKDEFNRGPTTDCLFRNGKWQLREGSYLIEFREELNTDNDHIPILFPHSNAMEVGVVVQPKFITDENLRGLLKVSKSVDIDGDAPVAIIVIESTKPPESINSLRGSLGSMKRQINEIKERVEELEDNDG